MKDKWRHYALKAGKVKKNYESKYPNRSQCRKTSETGSSDCLLSSEEIKEEINLSKEWYHEITYRDKPTESAISDGRCKDAEPGSDIEIIMDVSNVSRKRVKRVRKTGDSKRDNERIQKKEG